MAIKILSDIVTDKGLTTQLYVMIDSVDYIKTEQRVNVNVKTYFSEADRTESEQKTCKTFVIPRFYSYIYNMSDMNTNAYTYAYEQLTAQLSQNYITEQI